jgi:hypothetical protein
MPDSGALMIGTNLNGGHLALADLTGTTYTPTGRPRMTSNWRAGTKRSTEQIGDA